MEAYKLFEELVYQINEEVTSYLSKGMLLLPENRQVQEARAPQKVDLSRLRMSRPGGDSGGGSAPMTEEAARARAAAEGVSAPASQVTIRRQDPKVGRNDLCPCGSGKKFKHCHGR
jgi:preprotein translocase subunit SecA